MVVNTTLSHRGLELARGENMRDKFKTILTDPYDPDTNPDGFINMGVAENYAMIPDVTEYVNKHLQLKDTDFTYGEGPWGTERLRKAMAKYMTKSFDAIEKVDPEKLTFTNGVTSLCELLGFTIADPGDAILFPAPIYHAFQLDFGMKAKVRCEHTDFGDMDQFSVEAVDKYEEALLDAEKQGVHVRALMLCNPHNPLGRCYPKETIIGLMKLCNKYKIHLLCDEIYATSVYAVDDKHAVPFTSALSFDYSDYIGRDYVHVIYGMSKDFAAGGIRLGCMYSHNKELYRAISAITQFHWSGGPNEHLAAMMLEDEKWLEQFNHTKRERLAARNELTRSILEEAGVSYMPGANAGFFLWVDLRPYLPKSDKFESAWDAEEALSKKLVEAGVFLTDGKMLHSTEPGWYRVIFSQEVRTIKAGLQRLFKAVGVKD